MNRARMRVSAKDIAAVAGVSYRRVLRDIRSGVLVYGDLRSVVEYIMKAETRDGTDS